MEIKQYQKYSEKHPAIDGIAKPERPLSEKRDDADGYWVDRRRLPEERAIRSDVEEILGMNDMAFDSWYGSKKRAFLRLLNSFKVVGTTPELSSGSEDDKKSLDSDYFIGGVLGALKRGLENVEVIKKIRDEQKT